jgi:hypothetical protein
MVFMEHLTTLAIDPRDKDSAASYLASLKSELAHEKATWNKLKTKWRPLAMQLAI